MYERLFSVTDTFNDTLLTVSILPDFDSPIEFYYDNTYVFTSQGPFLYDTIDNKNWIVGTLHTTWMIIYENDAKYCRVYITENTATIATKMDSSFLNAINCLIKAAQLRYAEKKKNEYRLYFWDSSRQKLLLCYNHNYINKGIYSRISYYMRGKRPKNQDIGSNFDKPIYDCFLIGIVDKTIRISSAEETAHTSILFDYIQPLVGTIIPDFDTSLKAYGKHLKELEKIVLNVFIFYIMVFVIGTNDKTLLKISNFLKNTNFFSAKNINDFGFELIDAFNKGDTDKLRYIEKVLSYQQLLNL